MKKNLFLGMAALAMAATSFITTACDSLGDLDVTNPNQTALEANWLAQFGEIDGNQDWSLATTAPATISVYGIDALSDYQLQLYTANPVTSSNALLMASKAVTTDANGNASASFDAVDVVKGHTIYYACYMDKHNRRCTKPVALIDGEIKAQFGMPASSSAKSMRRKTENSDNLEPQDVQYTTVYNDVMTNESLAKEVNSANATENYPSNADFAKVLKISTSWNGNISVLPSNNKNGNLARTLYVYGTWTLNGEQKLGGDGLIVVCNGGTIEIPAGSSLASDNGGRIVVLQGGTIEGEGSLTFCNGSGDSFDYIASGATVNVGTLNNNGGTVYNYGTLKATELQGGSGNSVYINRNYMEVDHSTYGSTSANTRIYTCCKFVAKKDLCLRNLYMFDPSYAYIGGNLKMSISGDGTNDPSEIVMAQNAHLTVDGGVALNNTSIVGPTTGGAICEFGQIGDPDDLVATNYTTTWVDGKEVVTQGAVKNNLYISIEKTEDESTWVYDTPSPYFKFTQIMMNGCLYDVQYETVHLLGDDGIENTQDDQYVSVKKVVYRSGVKAGNGNTVIVAKGEAPITIPASDCGVPAYGKTSTPVTTPESQNFIIACEDLGDLDDYDFNDIVFSVGHVAGNNYITITPLAAGGSLPANIWYGETKIGEIHQLLGSGATSDFINTSVSGITAVGTVVTIGDVDENWTLADNIGKFSITVQKDDNKSVPIIAPAKGSAPFMIVVPANWQWPIERTNVGDAYPNFVDWSQNAATNDAWTNSRAAGKTVNR